MSSDDEGQYEAVGNSRNNRYGGDDDEDDIELQEGDEEEFGAEDASDNNDVLDAEGGDDDDGDQKITAWGTQKKRFYREGDEEEDDEAEEDEEEEAKLIEKLQNEQLTNDNFFDVFGDQEAGRKQATRDEEEDEDDEHYKGSALQARFRKMENLAESEKLALIQKESPELLNIIKEFKTNLKELKYKFLPLLSYVRENKLNMKEGQKYLETKFNLLVSYCMNLSFYILLNSQGKSVKDHPVIKRLISLKTLLSKLSPLDKKLQPEMDQILRTIAKEKDSFKAQGKSLKEKGSQLGKKSSDKGDTRQETNLFGDSGKGKKQAKKETEKTKEKAKGKKGEENVKKMLDKALNGELPAKKKGKDVLGKRGIEEIDDDIDDDIGDDDEDMEGLDGDDLGGDDEDDGEDEFYKKMKTVKKIKRNMITKEKMEQHKAKFEENPKHYVGDEDSRIVNKRIMKNKGLTRKRKKTAGNARVTLKNKFRKAEVKLKSMYGHTLRENKDYYGGEKSGIKAGIIRSTKLTYH